MSAHLDDLLSAYVDGQLTDQERVAVEDHLGVCPVCRGELAATNQIKAWVSGLPEVPAPFGFYERVLLERDGPRERRNRWAARAGAVTLAATASIWIGVIGLGGVGGKVGGMPALNSLVSAHLGADAPTERAPTQDGASSLRAQAEALGLPGEMPGAYELAAVVDRGREQQAIYSDGDRLVSVFVIAGYLDPRNLPRGTRSERLGAEVAWIVPSEPAMALAQRGDKVVVVVGSAPAWVTGEVDPPTSAPSLTDRLVAAGDGLLEAFGFG